MVPPDRFQSMNWTGTLATAVLILAAAAAVTAYKKPGNGGDTQVIDGSQLGDNNRKDGAVHISKQELESIEGGFKIYNENRDVCVGNCTGDGGG